MRTVRWKIDAGAILLIALAYFFDTSGMLSAFIPAAAAHELGHALAIRLCGSRVVRVRLSVFGLEMDHLGELTGARGSAAVIAGPLAGFAYAAACLYLPGRFWPMSGAISFILSAFNMIPIMPLDGGRMVSAISDPVFAKKLSRLAALLLLVSGVVILIVQHSVSLLAMALWLTVYNFR